MDPCFRQHSPVISTYGRCMVAVLSGKHGVRSPGAIMQPKLHRHLTEMKGGAPLSFFFNPLGLLAPISMLKCAIITLNPRGHQLIIQLVWAALYIELAGPLKMYGECSIPHITGVGSFSAGPFTHQQHQYTQLKQKWKCIWRQYDTLICFLWWSLCASGIYGDNILG